ncbi:unnamed protein product [Bursaphelenchus xylophilus]|uniref:(pine wood nematode) hypothetical protein n=1 Tax=Bursaphelenchus xylophilus TaxID=6326 RepID=A0A1I7RPF6_BURXY|nr:unnamed protein product [Bursaphelenchus xylophilus]CAG9095941.1 unnamed protein product [Bursaphelenchus xylophilus]
MEKERPKAKRRTKARTSLEEAPPEPVTLSDFGLAENLPNTSQLQGNEVQIEVAEEAIEDEEEVKETTPEPKVEVRAKSEEINGKIKEKSLDEGLLRTTNAMESKAKEAARGSSLIELPLDALLPKHSREETRVLPPAYPDLTALKTPEIDVKPPSPVERTRNLYPDLRALATAPAREEVIVRNETELLQEMDLLQYYHNEELDSVDDFVEHFNQKELRPRNLLYELLDRFKTACEQLERDSELKNQMGIQLSKTNNEVWNTVDHKIAHSGRCGCDRSAHGEAYYKKATLMPEKLVQLQAELNDLTSLELGQFFCVEIRARSLALQIQWIVIHLNNRFMSAQQLNMNSLPTLVSTQRNFEPHRTELIGALSDLFYFLRFPMLPKRFRDSVTNWIVELTSVLLKAISPVDQKFVVCQILRSPSPIDPWAVPLLQTFITVPTLEPKRAIDTFLALLALVLHPIQKREEFLSHFARFYEGDNEWNVVSEDGDTENVNLTDMNELDLIALFGQFSMSSLFSVALKHFTFVHQGNKYQIMLSLISFTLIVLKLLNQGLRTYNSLKNVSKKICDYIRRMTQLLSSYWMLSKDEMSNAMRSQVQNEINRVILIAVNHVISKKSVGLWQYLVDFPFVGLTEKARLRVILMLKAPKIYDFAKVFEIEDCKLNEEVKKGKLLEGLDQHEEDSTYSILVLASVVAECEKFDARTFMDELIEICFLDEFSREKYYKAGSEAVSVLLERKPELLPSILRYVDRQIDHLDAYAVDILTNASLKKCKISPDDIGSILGKWLVNRPVDHPASSIARRVLSSLDWSSEPYFLPPESHEICADTIVKSHIVHCKNRNSLISKSFQKAAKMASKCPDLEQNFDKFCWDTLVKLKITIKPSLNTPTSDLTAFYIYLMQKGISTPEIFMENGLNYWVELVNSGSFNAAAVVLASLVKRAYGRMAYFNANNSFREAFERLLRADESHFAVQFLMGADKFPGPVLKLLGSAIASQLGEIENPQELVNKSDGWFLLMASKKSIEWNEDKSVLYLLGIMARIHFVKATHQFDGMIEKFVALYKSLYNAWKDAPKGMLGWFSTQIPPPLISTTLMNVSPWLTYFLLRAEPQIYTQFYAVLYQNMGKHPARSLEECVKRAQSKSNIMLGVNRTAFYRWLEFCNTPEAIQSAVYPLALQQLCICLLKRENFERKKFCPGARYLSCPAAKPLFDELREKSLPQAEKDAENERLAGFIRATGQWIFNKDVYNPEFSNYNDLPMDYLVQMITSNDTHIWTEFISISEMEQAMSNESKFFNYLCYLKQSNSKANLQQGFNPPTDLTQFFAQIDSTSSAKTCVAFPAVPSHPNLTSADNPSRQTCENSPMILSRFQSYLDQLTAMARDFLACKETVERLNTDYTVDFQKLYYERRTNLAVTLRCGNLLNSECPKPAQRSVPVTESVYDNTVAVKMNENRQERENKIGDLLGKLDFMAINSAQLEHLCFVLLAFAKESAVPNVYGAGNGVGFGSKATDMLRQTGINVFYRLSNNVTAEQMLFPALMSAFENCCQILGSAFLFENPSEQLNILRIVLSGNPLNVYIIPHFSPHCVNSTELIRIYTELSTAVRAPSTAESALALLQRLDFVKAGRLLPPDQFSALMPVIFENLISVPASTPLHSLCIDHFQCTMFHQYPNNIAKGFKLLLSGIDAKAVPETILQTLSERLNVQQYLVKTRDNIIIDQKSACSIVLAIECLTILSDQLKKSRHEQTTKLYSIWGNHLGFVTQFAEYFIKNIVCQQFRSDAPTSVMEKELRDVFLMILNVWTPLLEPIPPDGLAPFNPSDSQIADVSVVQPFINLLIWLPYSTYLPPGSETVESLVWQFFSSKLSQLQRAGTSHVFSVYEKRFVSLNWARFWPTLMDLASIERVCTDGSPEAMTLITDVMVRIQWIQLIQGQMNQPLEAHRAFHSLLLSILARCAYRQQNYAKSRASVEKLLRDFLSLGYWSMVKVESVEKTSNFISTSFPVDSLTNGNSIITAFNNIWKEVCFFTTTQIRQSFDPTASDPEIIAKKQSLYIKADLQLLLRSKLSEQDQCRHYKELLDKVCLLIGASENYRAQADVARELISFWPQVTKPKILEGLYQTLIQWLEDHPDSTLLLLVLTSTVNALGVTSPQMCLRLLDWTIRIYFKRRLSCNWNEVCNLVTLSSPLKEWLYATPSSDSGNEPRFLVLHTNILTEMSKASASDEQKLIRRISDYFSTLKPKYINFEAGFVLCIDKWLKLVVKQYSNGINVATANANLDSLQEFLKKTFTEEKGVSLFNVMAIFSKKSAFPPKIQLVCQILNLYLTQQQTSSTQSPRLQGTQAVLNSRQSAFKDIRKEATRQFTSIDNIEALFQQLYPYFHQVNAFTLLQASDLMVLVIKFIYPNSHKMIRAFE